MQVRLGIRKKKMWKRLLLSYRAFEGTLGVGAGAWAHGYLMPHTVWNQRKNNKGNSMGFSSGCSHGLGFKQSLHHMTSSQAQGPGPSADTEPVRGREKPSSPGSPPPFRAQGGGAGSSVARLQLAHLHPCSKEKWE